ncbi:ATP-binding cassette domain-containing protein [Flexivirga caeni]|uniref:ABC transporter ATP-binding protein n=1 Tax=Flexivirga caeni TaxID=2294115 RepID=A0A3M9MEE1_9MICO|nr:ABC transporter ATP-binding protein [Flexivirga caeni]RNI23940.1 ABC transporter ATP-binding protein [Flexivirga caeni]
MHDAALPLAGAAILVVAWTVTIVAYRLRRAPVTTVADDAVLRVHGLTKRYGERVALDDVTFALPRGAVLALMGPNGAGKTTLLQLISGLALPSAGAAYVLGERVAPGSAVLRRAGIALEEPGFAPHLTGRANLETLWRVSGRPADEAQLDLAAQLAGLTPYLDRRARDYSQGMKQRLAIAGALLGLPDLLILDEPANGLDPARTRPGT